MTTGSYSQVQLDIKLKEYDHLKHEIKSRLHVAFSHVAFAGAIVAFALPAAERMRSYGGWTLLLAIIGILGLCWVAALNMRWVQHLGHYLGKVEADLNESFGPGTTVLGWETYASRVQAYGWILLPKRPNIPETTPLVSPPPLDASDRQ